MYYELYIDVLFLVNFMMDYLLLLLVRKMLKCTATLWFVFLGALTGSLLTCIVMILPIPSALIKFFLFHLVINTSMIRVGLRVKTLRQMIQSIILLYIGSFLMGGIMQVLRQYIKMGSLFFAVALGGYYLTLGIWKFVSYLQRWNCYHCEVEICLKGKIKKVRGIIDTGNGLRDPVSGHPVSILDRKAAEELLEGNEVEMIRYIPYRTIGKNDGILPVFRIDQLRIHGDKACCIQTPLIAISEEKISAREEYEMILNPNLF